jgi:septal ring factor EnvC (AmiA/AmiB activator)
VWRKKIFSIFPKSLVWLLLWAALCWGLPLPLYSLESGPTGSGSVSENELSRLIEISNQLADLNERLRNELEDSRKNSKSLQDTLGKSKEELDSLRAELEHLRAASTALLNTQEESQTDLALLQTALTKAESSLTSLEQSFAAYRQTAELRIARLEKARGGWRIAFWAACGAALAGTITAAAVMGAR